MAKQSDEVRSESPRPKGSEAAPRSGIEPTRAPAEDAEVVASVDRAEPSAPPPGDPEPAREGETSEAPSAPGSIADARPFPRENGDPTYPDPSDRELRLAGWGCLGMVAVTSLALVAGFGLAFVAIDDTGGGEVTATVVSEAMRQESAAVPGEPAEPREPRPALVSWERDVAAGIARAEVERRPMVVFFEAEWASASRDMREGTFEDPSVVESLEPFVPILVDMSSTDEATAELKEAHEVRFVPHVLFLGPGGEALRPASEGLVGPEDLRVMLSDALAVQRERETSTRGEPANGDGE